MEKQYSITAVVSYEKSPVGKPSCKQRDAAVSAYFNAYVKYGTDNPDRAGSALGARSGSSSRKEHETEETGMVFTYVSAYF